MKNFFENVHTCSTDKERSVVTMEDLIETRKKLEEVKPERVGYVVIPSFFGGLDVHEFDTDLLAKAVINIHDPNYIKELKKNR